MELKKYCAINLLTNVRNDGKKVDKKNIQCWYGIRDINNNVDDDITEEL
jgi:hypothetical protein